MFTKKPERQAEPPVEAKPAETPPTPATAEAPPRLKPSDTFGGSGKMAPSIIGEDLSVTGNIVSKGTVQVEGEVQGDIHCASVIIGENAHVTGGLISEEVVVRGRVSGSVRATRVTLQASSHVEGDIYHQSIAIEQGAFFEGKSRRSENPTEMKTEGKARPSKAPAPTPTPAPAQSNGSPQAKAEEDAKPPHAAE